jgi:hypothetical protein
MEELELEKKWEEGIYQIETTDPVMGGPDGIWNKPLKQIGNRTEWLKDQVEAVLPVLDEINGERAGGVLRNASLFWRGLKK